MNGVNRVSSFALVALAMIAVATLAVGSRASAEALINPGFESAFGSPPEWTATVESGTVPVADRDTESQRSGSYGGHIQITTGSKGHAYLEQVVSGLIPGASCTVSAWMRHVWDRTDKYHVYIEALGGGSPQVSAYSTTYYAQYTLTQTADGSGQLRLRLHVDKYTTTTSDKVCDGYFDDCSVVPEGGGPAPNPPTGGGATADSANQITWGWTRASGASGELYRAYDQSTGGTAKWTSSSQATSYAESGLDANTLYGSGAAAGNQRHLATLQGVESETRLALPAKYTLAAVPSYDDTVPYADVTVRCDMGRTKTNCTAGQNITFTYNNAFGSGPSNVSKFAYAWLSTSSWDGTTGAQNWTSGATLVKQAGGDGSSYYLHLRSWNSDAPQAQNTTTLTLGPYSVGGGGPALPAIAVKHHTTGIFDGQTWETAFDKVQDAIDAAGAGDEIWVASGTYVENIVLKDAVALYGGFAGTETSRSQRNWNTNVTVLDGDGGGPVVEVVRNATSSTRIDGFTITNGRAITGGGIYCNQGASPVIVNNVITGNLAEFDGGGIHCNLGSAAVIAANKIVSNGAVGSGGGVRATTGPVVMTSNLIACNSARIGGGICCGDSSTASSESIRNNTIASNAAIYGGGIYCVAMSSASICNNIVAFNSNGIRVESGSGSPVLRKNCVNGNTDYAYSGISQGGTDILSDPQLASVTYGNYHIQPSSPCRNAGNNSDVISGYTDIDGQTRIQNTTVDMGADESDGTTWTVNPAIVRVTTSGSDSNNGSTWPLAKRTIQAGIDAAAASGGEVWVKAGTYGECIVLRDHVYVYGGFAGSEAQRTQRNWTTNVSTVDGGASGSVATASLMGYRVSAIDGLKLQNGQSCSGAGVYVGNASPQVMNNTITGNASTGNGGGVYLATSLALVKANQITDNSALGYGGGVFCYASGAEVSRNNIENNSACVNGCGVYGSRNDTSDLVNNRIVNNHRLGSGSAWGSGVSVDSYSGLTMICNTVADNTSATGSVYAGVYGYLRMYSSIVSFNSSGIVKDTNSTVDQVASFTGDPLFVNRAGGDYRLQTGSPCIDAADPATAPTEDYAGNGRPVDGDNNGSAIADIGCYEYGSFVPEEPVPPTSATATPSSMCTGAGSTLHAYGGSGTVLRWLIDGCDGSSVGTGNDLVVYPITTTTYYARWETVLGNSTCVSTTVTITGEGPVATVGGPQTIPALGTTQGLGGNTPEPPATGEWSVVSGGTGTFSSTTDPDATFTHTGGDGPIVLRWTVSSPPCDPATADVTVTIGYHCLDNGNFDGGFTDGVADGWAVQQPASGTFSRETTIKHSGVASQNVTDPSGGSTYTTFLYQTVSVQPGKTYVPTLWIYRLNSAVARIGVDPDGGTNFVAGDAIPTSNQWVYREDDAFVSGPSGEVSIGLAAGYQTNSGTVYYDDIAIKPQSPQSTGGTTTITAGESTTITASGGFDGEPYELAWYTGPAGTGTLAGFGTSLIVSPTSTTTYYPRWEAGGACGISDDGSPVTVTVLPAGPPTVTSISPSSGANTGAVSITDLAGTGFVSGATVELSRIGETDITADSVNVVSSTKITCSLDLTGRKIGLWDVVVTNPDAQSDTLDHGFGITVSDSLPLVGATIRSLLDAVASPASLTRRFCIWGEVELIDSSSFRLDDGSGTRIKVFAPGYSGIASGDFVSAIGGVDVSSSPPVLVSSADRVRKY